MIEEAGPPKTREKITLSWDMLKTLLNHEKRTSTAILIIPLLVTTYFTIISVCLVGLI